MKLYDKISRFFIAVLLLVACCCLTGCETRAKISGKVHYPDGSPVTVGEVRGYSDGTHIRSPIKEDGGFELFEIKPGDKVPAGKTYEISIVNAEVAEKIVMKPGMAPPTSLPKTIVYVHPKFANPATSELKLEVPKSSKPVEYNIEVVKP